MRIINVALAAVLGPPVAAVARFLGRAAGHSAAEQLPIPQLTPLVPGAWEQPAAQSAQPVPWLVVAGPPPGYGYSPAARVQPEYSVAAAPPYQYAPAASAQAAYVPVEPLAGYPMVAHPRLATPRSQPAQVPVGAWPGAEVSVPVPAAVAAPTEESCPMMGGLLTASLSAGCCFSVQVVAQRGLHAFGLAQGCKPTWDCESDKVTPTSKFEDRALKQMCAETQCMAGVVNAMRGNWMTSRAADWMAHACDADSSVSVAEGTLRVLFSTGRQLSGGRWIFGNETGEEGHSGEESHSIWTKCFPGHATVAVRGGGSVPMASLRVSQEVLVARGDGSLAYEPVLAFLHASTGGRGRFLTVTHRFGQFRASPGHIVFFFGPDGKRADKTAAELRAGDLLLALPTSGHEALPVPSEVLAIEEDSSNSGMYAPLTHTGTILVDGVVASNYAAPAAGARLPHWVAHSVLAPARAYHGLGLGQALAPVWARWCSPSKDGAAPSWLCQGGGLPEGAEKRDELHPLVDLAFTRLRMDKVLNQIWA